MRSILILAVVVVAVCVNVKAIPTDTPIGEEEQATTGTIDKGIENLKKIEDDIPKVIKNITRYELRSPPQAPQAPALGLGIGTLYNALLGGVHSLYQDLLNRQQAFINLLTCGNCVNDGWDAIMDVAMTIPELDWVLKPSEQAPTTFFTAIHQNGTVTGIGGSVVNGKPVAEYAFGNEGIKQRLTEKNKDKEKEKQGTNKQETNKQETDTQEKE